MRRLRLFVKGQQGMSDKPMSDTDHVAVGPMYCTTHHGIQEEDETTCDFWEIGTEPCALTPLLIRQSPVMIGSVRLPYVANTTPLQPFGPFERASAHSDRGGAT